MLYAWMEFWLAPRLPALTRVVCLILAAYMTVGVVLIVARRVKKSRFLFFQASYIIALQLIVLTAAYLNSSR